MKIVILCGGKGTRISEETRVIPKPMIKINNILLDKIKIRFIDFFIFKEK